MKKQFIILSTLLVLASGLKAMAPSINSIKYEINAASAQINHYALDTNSMFADSTKHAFNLWNEAFAKAKNFVLNNSKNMMGTQDPDLVNAMRSAEQANSTFLAVINKIRATSDMSELTKQQTALNAITGSINTFMANLNNATMVLPNKRDAKEAILKIGTELNDMISSLSPKVTRRR